MPVLSMALSIQQTLKLKPLGWMNGWVDRWIKGQTDAGMDGDSLNDTVRRLAILTIQDYAQHIHLHDLPTVLDYLCVICDDCEHHQFSFPPHYFWWAPSYKKTLMGPEGASFPARTKVRHANGNALSTASTANEGQ